MDVVAVHRAMKEARRIIRGSGGPVVVGRSAIASSSERQPGRQRLPLSHRRRRSRMARPRSDRPGDRASHQLSALPTDDELAPHRSTVTERGRRCRGVADRAGSRRQCARIPQALWPNAADVDHGILGDLSELGGRASDVARGHAAERPRRSSSSPRPRSDRRQHGARSDHRRPGRGCAPDEAAGSAASPRVRWRNGRIACWPCRSRRTASPAWRSVRR